LPAYNLTGNNFFCFEAFFNRMQRDEAVLLLKSHVISEGLINHCIATAAIMRTVAVKLGENQDKWELIGILHNIDFEETGGGMCLHGAGGYRILIEAGIDEEIAGPVKRHNYELYGESGTPVDTVLTAAVNISGLAIACALVKGGEISAVSGKRLRKR
jgi:putative nucleotidyltransferase with HDIG domain